MDLLAHFAAARPGRGEEPCSCCRATGEHEDRSECDRCDGSGRMHRGDDAASPWCPGRENDQPSPPRRRHWREPKTATIRRVPPEEYSKYVYPDYPRARTPATLARYLRKHEPDYYATLHAHIAEHGVQEPVLLRTKDPRGQDLKRPVVMSGHHRAAVAYEQGRDIPVGDYDNDEDYAQGRPFAQQWWQQHGELKQQYDRPPMRRQGILHGPDELPPDPGTAPIPEGHVRLWHYTRAGNVPSIREHGLQRKYARGDSGTGDLSEPSAGVWASTKRPDDVLDDHTSGNAAVVEYHAHPDEISGNAESPWQAAKKGGGYDPDKLKDWASGYHHVIMHGDVHPHQILAIHEGWHGAARYMKHDDPSLKSYQWIHDESAEPWNDHLNPYRRGLQALERERGQQHEGARTVTATQPYSMQHEGPDPGEGEGLHEIGSGKIWPTDFHQRPWEYQLGADEESMDKVRGSRDWPSRKVWAYRALPSPHREVNTGDWVSTSKRYARSESRASSNPDDDYPVVKFQARAEHLRNEGNSLDEWSYTGPKVNRALVHFSGGKNHRNKGGRGKTDAMCYEHEPEEMFSAYEQANRERREKRKAEQAAREREGARVRNFTNWDDALRELRYRKRNEPLMHRGMAVELPPEVHSFVHDQFQSRDQQARAIVRHLAGQPLGMHWAADDERPSRHFAEWHKKNALPGSTKVILHAALPESAEHIETDPEKLREGGVFRHDSWSSEREIPMKEGAPVNIRAVTWYGYGNRKRTGHLWGEEHTAVMRPGLRNPHTGGPEWFHGSQATGGELKRGFTDPMEMDEGAYQQPADEDSGHHWNSLLGNHFTADHDIAKSFASGQIGGERPGGFRGIVHARLGIANPKVYASEHDMDHEAYEHEYAAGNHPSTHIPLDSDDEDDRAHVEESWPEATRIHQQYRQHKIPRDAIEGSFGYGRSPHTPRTTWLNTHPDKWGIADRFRRRLQAQGHDGIIYGNEYEVSQHGEDANKAAIVFDPGKIQVTQHHPMYDDCSAQRHTAAAEPRRFFHGTPGPNTFEPGDLLTPGGGGRRQMAHVYYTSHLPSAARYAGWGQPLGANGRPDLDADAVRGHVYEVAPETRGGKRTGRHAEDPDSGLPGNEQAYRTKGRLRVLHEVDRDTGEPLGQVHEAARDISRIRLKHEPPIVSGHWERDEQGVPSHWVDTDPAQGHHMLTALAPNNRTVGWMHWDKGVVRKIDVNDNWQHSGLGRRMWEHASAITPGLSHSDNRTEEGQGFAQAVGGPLPERVQDHPEWFHEAAWTPSARIFGPTYGLDHRLFTPDERLKPEVRHVLLGRLQGVLEPLLGPAWDKVTRVCLAGSEASRWTSPELEGNGDLDVLIGVAYSYARNESDQLAGLTDLGIDKHLNAALQQRFNYPGWHPPFGPEDTYDLTGYVNNRALDIRAINPYAAYDLTADEWAVKPPDLPSWSAEQFPQGPALMQEARALIGQVRAVLRMPEPFRTQEASRLWDYIHEGRRRDFSEQGLGWMGAGNVLEKALDQASGKLVEKLKALKYGPPDHAPVALGHGMTTADLGSAHA